MSKCYYRNIIRIIYLEKETMKFWVKILVALAVVVVLAFGVWAFFFKETDESMAFNRVTELVDYKQSLGLKERLETLESYNYLAKDKTKVIPTDTAEGKNIYKIKNECFSDEDIVLTDSNGNTTAVIASYLTYEEKIDEIIEYLLPHMNGTRVNSKARKTVTSAVNIYISSLKDLSASIDNVFLSQESISGTEIELKVLSNNYTDLKLKYRESLSKAADVVTTAVEYVNVSVYNNKFKADTRFALYDCFGIALKYAMSIELIQEYDFSNDAKLVLDKIEAFDKKEVIFNDTYSEYSFLESYNKLLTEYHNELKAVLSKTNVIKKNMADNKDITSVVNDAKESVMVVLNVLGF